jgi:hypothetical protein
MCNKLKLNKMKEQLEDLFKTLDHQIDVCRSSIFTANDVKIMYNGLLPEIIQIIESKSNVDLPMLNLRESLTTVLSEALTVIEDRLDCTYNNCEYIDYESAEFQLDYGNQLSLERVDLNSRSIVNVVHETFDNAFDEMIQSLKVEVEPTEEETNESE